MTRPTTFEPVRYRTILVAGFLDQLIMIGAFLLSFWVALTILETVDSEGSMVGVGIAGAIFVPVVWLSVQAVLATRLGSTAGTFLRGIRLDPREPISLLDAFEGLFEFWGAVVTLPVAWILHKIAPSMSGADQPTGFVTDPRTTTPRARMARVALAVFIVAAPLPLLLRLLT